MFRTTVSPVLLLEVRILLIIRVRQIQYCTRTHFVSLVESILVN